MDAADTAGRGRGGSENVYAAQDAVQGVRAGMDVREARPRVVRQAAREASRQEAQRVARRPVASGRGATLAHQGADVPATVVLLTSYHRCRVPLQ